MAFKTVHRNFLALMMRSCTISKMFLSTLLVLSVLALQISLETWYSEYINTLYDEKKMLCKSTFHDLQDFNIQNAEVFSGREVLSLNFSISNASDG